jgi:hypothetical protein
MKHAKLNTLLATLFLIGVAGCAITPERQREARLMPESVALEIVTRYTNPAWARNPGLKANLANHPACGDQIIYPAPYNTITVSWDLWGVSIVGEHDVGFWCGTYTSAMFKISDTQEQDDLIDAFVSLGAKTKVGSK